MNGKERIAKLFNGQNVDRAGFWLGSPTKEAKQNYMKYFDAQDEEMFNLVIKNDLVWISSEWDAWIHPEGKPMFDFYGGKGKKSHGQRGQLADCEDVSQVDAFNWPDTKYLDFEPVTRKIEWANSNGLAVAGGMWTCFFQNIARLFGMENYFIKMHTNPEVVEAVTERVIDFYLRANKLCFETMASKIDVFFLGNDLGTQEDLLISPEMFRKFILPGFKKVIELAKSYNLKVMLHSCGAISKLIPDFIDAGVDALHPLQARARGMDAEFLAKEYKNYLLFVGGVDTQHILPFSTPDEIKNEVRRLRKVFGEHYIVSPSHEGLLPNVSAENVAAMRDAALQENK